MLDVACGGRGPEYPIGDGKYWHRARCIDHCGTRYPHDAFIPLWECNMPSSDAFALRRSGLNEFLFAPVGTVANGMTLSVVSVFSRLGNDPWQEAGRLAGIAKVGSDRKSGANHRQHANQRLATTSRDDDCRPIDCTTADASREPRAESVSISLWCKGRPNYQDWPRAGGRRVRSGLSNGCLHDIRRTKA